MAKLFAGQSELRIRLTMSIDITDATTVQIKYRKPDKTTTGEWDAVTEIEATGVIYYDVLDGDIPAADYGEWLFWAYVVFSDGRNAPGEAVRVKFWKEPST